MFTNSIGTSRTSPPLLHRKGLRGHPNAVRLDLSRSSTARWNADRSRFLLTPRHGKQMSDINNVKSKDQDIQSCLIHHQLFLHLTCLFQNDCIGALLVPPHHFTVETQTHYPPLSCNPLFVHCTTSLHSIPCILHTTTSIDLRMQQYCVVSVQYIVIPWSYHQIRYRILKKA